jgi:hypothetical protein
VFLWLWDSGGDRHIVIETPSILVTSIGRTGTEFFARFFAHILPDATSLHEPDIFQNTGVENKLACYLQQVQRAGPWRMVVLKALGKWTLVQLSDSRFLGDIDQSRAVRDLNTQRKGFIEGMPSSIYVEANIGYYGLLDITPQVFREHRAIYLVRDGREWIRSHMNWGEFYGKKGIRKLISHNWPAASDVPGDPCAADWTSFSRFERLCWAWSALNTYALDTIPGNPNARLFRFEEVFSSKNRYRSLEELVAFATSLPCLASKPHGNINGWLEKRTHQSPAGFPSWDGWTADQKDHFDRICGPLMQKLGYY